GDLSNIGGGSRLFSDGFEDGGEKLWANRDVTGSSTVEASTAAVHSGKYALEVAVDGGNARLYRHIRPTNTIAMRAYVNLASYTSGSFVNLMSAEIEDTGENFSVEYNASTGKLAHYCETCAITDQDTAYDLVVGGGWHKIEQVIAVQPT